MEVETVWANALPPARKLGLISNFNKEAWKVIRQWRTSRRRTTWILAFMFVLGLALLLPHAAAQYEEIVGTPSFSDTNLSVVSRRFPATEEQVRMMAELPWATVEASELSGDAQVQRTRIELAARASSVDIFYTDSGTIPEFHEGLEPLNAYIEEYWDVYQFADIPASAWEQASVGGQIYAIPTAVNNSILYYRSDLFEELGLTVPHDFNELLSVAEALTADGRAGLSLSLKNGEVLMNVFGYLLWSSGGDFFNDAWEPTFQEEPGAFSLRLLNDLTPFLSPEAMSFGVDEVMVELQQGQAAMGLQWASRALPMDDETVSRVVGKIEYAVPPVRSGNAPATRSSINAWSVSRYSQNKEQAFHAIAYVAAARQQSRIAALQVPSRVAVAMDPVIAEEFRWYVATLQTFEASKPFPQIPEWFEIQDELSVQIQRYLLGQIGAEEALERAAVTARQILSRAGYY